MELPQDHPRHPQRAAGSAELDRRLTISGWPSAYTFGLFRGTCA